MRGCGLGGGPEATALAGNPHSPLLVREQGRMQWGPGKARPCGLDEGRGGSSWGGAEEEGGGGCLKDLRPSAAGPSASAPTQL